MRKLKFRLWLYKQIWNFRFNVAYAIFKSLALPIWALGKGLEFHIAIRRYLILHIIREGNINQKIDADFVRSYRIKTTLAVREERDIIDWILRL